PAAPGRGENLGKLIERLVGQGIGGHRMDQGLDLMYGPQDLQRTTPTTQKRRAYKCLLTNPLPMAMAGPLGSEHLVVKQRQRRNVLALLAPEVYPKRLTAQGEAERPYDVAGWTLPLQMGIEAPAVTQMRETPAERKLTLVKDGNQVRADLALALRKG